MNGSGTSYALGATYTFTGSNTTLYAIWALTYTVTYNGNSPTSGTVPTDSSSPYASGSSVTVKTNTGNLTKTNYVFSGWNTASDGSGTTYQPNATFSISANTTLYAIWTPTYTVTYSNNGGSGTAPTDSSSPYSSGATVTVKSGSGLSNTNHVFGGWNTASDGSGTTYQPNTTFSISANTTLYAIWAPVIGWQYSSYTMSENFAAALGTSQAYPMNIVLSYAVNYDINVTYNTVDDTAIGTGTSGGTDFRTITNQTVTIPAGSTSVSVNMDIYHDDPIEGDENFTVVLSNPVGSGGVVLGTGTATDIIPAQDTNTITLPQCYQDNFNSSSLDSSWRTLFSSGGFTPQIISNRLRMTPALGNIATAITKDYQFPSQENVIVVEFTHYAYSGSGADGLAFVLYDSAIGASPTVGAFGGSLGYAQKCPNNQYYAPYGGTCTSDAGTSGANGFQGGWLGLGLDEFGNYENPNEGRIGGNNFISNGVSIRGSGNGQTGYNFLQGTVSQTPPLWTNSTTPSPGDKFRMTVDARDPAHLYIQLQRDTTGTGNNYQTIISNFDAKASQYNQSATPAFVRLALTASTGGSNAIHEIDDLTVWGRCTPYNPSVTNSFDAWENIGNDSNSPPSNRSIYTKITNLLTSLRVGSIDGSGSVYRNYTDGLVGWRLVNSATCPNGDGNITGWSTVDLSSTNPQTISFTPTIANQDIRIQFATYTNGVYSSTRTCSSDDFAIRPTNYTATFSPSGTLIAGNDFNLTLIADPTLTGYNGIATINPLTQINSCPVQDGNLTDSSGNHLINVIFNNTNDTNISNLIKFLDVGNFNITVMDSTWTNVDNNKLPLECTADNSTSYVNGKVGCFIQSVFNKTVVPDHFDLNTSLMNHNLSGLFTYMDSDLNVSADLNATVTAKALGGTTTQNYNSGCYAQITNYHPTYSLSPSPTPPSLNNLIFKETYSNLSGSKAIGSDFNLSNVPNSVFTTDINGSARLNFKINFDRNVTIAVNPFTMNIVSLDINDTNIITNVSGTNNYSGSATFLYGRTHAPRYRFPSNTGNANIYYETYCDTNGNKALLPSGSIGDSDSVGWYLNRVQAITDGVAGSVTEKNITPKIAQTTASAPSNGFSTVTLIYNGSTFPYKTTMENNASNWLIYNPYDPSAISNEFEVEFYQSSTNWTGHKVDINMTTTDSNATTTTSKRILW